MADEAASSAESKTRPARRSIPGNLPYTTSPGVLKRSLEKIVTTERPARFTQDYLGTVIGARGGAAAPIIPILKKVGFLATDGTPTDRYSRFKSESKRAMAALEALKEGFGEIFRRNEYAHRLDERGVQDIVVEITGLVEDDPIVRAMVSTFGVFQIYARNASGGQSVVSDEGGEETIGAGQPPSAGRSPSDSTPQLSLGISNQINLILPDTTNIEVFNAIFKSLKENLLQ